MNYQQIEFLKSAVTPDQFPEDNGSEVAFAGRSNSGKSSALNALTKHKNIARVSKTPGRTQLINFFILSDQQSRLVDLPGYGYAKVGHKTRDKWQAMIESYLKDRFSLKAIVLMVDMRHPLKDFDLMMLDYAYTLQKPVHILLTKADKLSRNQQIKTKQLVSNELNKRYAADFCSVQTFSALNNQGVNELTGYMDELLYI